MPFPSPGDLLDLGIKPVSLELQADFSPSEPPGKFKNRGVGSLSLLQGIFPTQESNWGLLHCKWILYQMSYQGNPSIRSVQFSRSVMSDSLQPHDLYSPRNSPGQNTAVGCHSLLQGSFPTQGSNPGLLHCKWILYQLRHKGSPRILEWVAHPFSSGSSRPRN